MALVLASTAGWAQTTPPVASRLTQVKLYPGVAAVERTARVAAGARQFIFDCLPARLDVNSLLIDADAGVRLGETAVRTRPRELATECRSPLEDRIRSLERQIDDLGAELAGLAHADGYLGSFKTPAADGASGRGAAQIGPTAEALQRAGKSVQARRTQIERQQQELTEALKPLVAERDRIHGADSRVASVQVTLAAAQAGDVRLTYQVRGVGWEPSYRAQLDTGARSLTLLRLAQVAQNTGEDWTDVPIVLSTGQPGAATSGPLPRPWRLAEQPPVTLESSAELRSAPARALAAPAPSAKMDVEADSLPSFDASVFNKGFATEFVVPQRITVPSNGERVTLTLGEQRLPARLAAQTTPALQAAAYLVARVDAPQGVWPPGALALYRDGAYVGAGRLDTAALARDGLAFGRDELVTVRMEPVAEVAGSGGFIGGRTERRLTTAFEIQNRHDKDITLQVLDAAPVSGHEKITVESRYEPAPQDTAWNGQPGTVQWELPLAAGATQRIAVEHLISHPADMRVRELR
ncbi:mucoidy inhibitor MuiA family protein [Pseudothauera rhizosphaerae]|uniref:Mucoidy inhibitor MuiA family protein n=1 Tax=Pseudothauera rhizosphaerae TaxID=2565932 RepID=A0A4S4AJI6_9RHOO|nr:mucoidy inhibitor MuiA family protein [Pseudothauera rhizosphaerae]